MVTAKRRFDAKHCLPILGNRELAGGHATIDLLVPCLDLDRNGLPSGLSSTGDQIFGRINQHCRFYQALYSLPGQHRRHLRLLCKLIGFYGMCGDPSSCKMQVGRIHGLNDIGHLPRASYGRQQCVIDVPGVDCRAAPASGQPESACA